MTMKMIVDATDIRQLGGLEQVCFECRWAVCDPAHPGCRWARALRQAPSVLAVRVADDQRRRAAVRAAV